MRYDCPIGFAIFIQRGGRSMQYAIPGDVLRFARTEARMQQATLAKALDTNGTFVSRLEKSGAVDPAFAERYLKAVGSTTAAEVLEYYNRPWTVLDSPSFLHPDREHLWRVEQTLQQLIAFEQSDQNHPILASTISALRDDLMSVLRYLERLDHVIAWVGDIGVGKTTALAFATRLVTSDGKGQPRSVFPVGSGRVTVCETVIKTASAFGVAVDPLDEDAIRALVRDLVAGVAGGQTTVPAELVKLLRNMSGYKVHREPVGDNFETRDKIALALAAGEDQATLVDKIVAAMDLPLRRETSVAVSEDDEGGMQWLAQTIARINSGTDPRFSVPRRITVLVPSDALRSSGELSIVDTKGVEATTQRPDLRGYLDDPRTLVVLCSKFPDAPNATVQRILRENEEAGSDATALNRVVLLVLPRQDEPLQVVQDGEAASSRLLGCAIRRDEINDALSGAGLPRIAVSFYDAHADKPDAVWAFLREQTARMRQVYIDRLDRAACDVAELVTDVRVVKTREARRSLEDRFERLADRIESLPNVRRPAHQNLIEQLRASHQSSVAASMVRRGDWLNFSVLHILGVGVRQDANLRSTDHISRVEHALEEAEAEYTDLAAVRAILASIRDRLAKWRQEFLGQAQSIGADGFKELLFNQRQLWADSVARYGTYVPGYKNDLAAIWQNFFEGSEPDEARKAVEARLAEAWASMVVEPLRAAIRAEG